MKLKTIVAIVGLAAAGSALAANGTGSNLHAQIQNLQQQVANLQQQVNQMGSSQGSSTGSSVLGQYVQLNPALTTQLLGNFGGVNGEMAILNAKKNMQNNTLYVGGYGEFGLTWGAANRSYTTVSSNDPVSKSSTSVTVDHLNVGLVGNLNQYAAAYIEAGHSDIGAAHTSDLPTFRQAYVLLGNGVLPVYGFVGRKDIDFGNFSTVNMFAQPLTRELFEVNGNTAGVGYNAYGFNVVASLMNGGANGNLNVNEAGFWGPGLPSDGTVTGLNGLYTNNGNQLNNFALNANYGMTTNGINWNVGAGYLNGLWIGNSLYNNSSNQRIGAWDINAQAGFQGLTFLAEYVSTAQSVNYGSGGKGRLSAWDLGSSYAFNAGVIPNQSVVSFDYSGSRQGASDSTTNNQFVVGVRNQVWPKANLWAGIEYAYDHIAGATSSGTLNNNNVRLDLTANF